MNTTMASPDRSRVALFEDAQIRRALRARVARTVPAQDVEDLVQGTLAEAWAAPDAPRERSAFRAWLLLKARSNAIDLLRRRARAARLFGERAGDDADGVSVMTVDADDVCDRRALLDAQLAKDPGLAERMAWLLDRAAGKSYIEIAAAAGAKPDTVRKSVQHTQRRLQAGLAAAVVLFALFALLRGLYGRQPSHEQALPPPPAPVPTVAPSPAAPSPSATAPKQDRAPPTLTAKPPVPGPAGGR